MTNICMDVFYQKMLWDLIIPYSIRQFLIGKRAKEYIRLLPSAAGKQTEILESRWRERYTSISVR